MYQTKLLQKTKQGLLVFSYFLPRNLAVYEIMLQKYCAAGQATGDNMAHAHYTLDT